MFLVKNLLFYSCKLRKICEDYVSGSKNQEVWRVGGCNILKEVRRAENCCLGYLDTQKRFSPSIMSKFCLRKVEGGKTLLLRRRDPKNALDLHDVKISFTPLIPTTQLSNYFFPSSLPTSPRRSARLLPQFPNFAFDYFVTVNEK